MEEIFDKDDAIGRLVREEGLMKTSSGFTSRVMDRVNLIPQKTEIIYKPLISKGTWTLILLGFLTLAGISPFVLASEKATDLAIFDGLKPVLNLVDRIHFSFIIGTNTLMLTTIIIASAGLLLLMDYFLNKRFSEN